MCNGEEIAKCNVEDAMSKLIASNTPYGQRWKCGNEGYSQTMEVNQLQTNKSRVVLTIEDTLENLSASFKYSVTIAYICSSYHSILYKLQIYGLKQRRF